jgi:uncharacterized membrane protein YedE/YeeE
MACERPLSAEETLIESLGYGAPLLGGIILGLAAALLMLTGGRILGISGIVGGLLQPAPGERAWRVAFVGGLLAGGAVLAAIWPEQFHNTLDRSVGAVAIAGLLVGFGSRLGNGCTSGHGICGVARLSPRSIAATGTFMATGVGVAVLIHLAFGGSV